MFRRPIFAIAAVLLLAGCSAGTPAPPAEPARPAPQATDEPNVDDCVVGTWNLDVATYSSDSESYIVSLGVPLDSFAMDGAGKLTFTNDGLVAADIDLFTTASVRGKSVAAPSTYTTSGDWSRTGESALQFDNWTDLAATADVTDETDLPGFDVTQLTGVKATCSANSLYLQGSEAPFGSTWKR